MSHRARYFLKLTAATMIGLSLLVGGASAATLRMAWAQDATMFAGKIVEIGDAKSVLADPQHAYAKKLIAAVPTIARRKQNFEIATRQIPSLVRTPGFEPPAAKWLQCGEDHKVRAEAHA